MNANNEADEKLEAIVKAAIVTLNVMIGENSPCPELRQAWYESFEDITSDYLFGRITMRQAEKIAEEKRNKFLQFVVWMFLVDKNEISEDYVRSLYNKMRADAAVQIKQ